MPRPVFVTPVKAGAARPWAAACAGATNSNATAPPAAAETLRNSRRSIFMEPSSDLLAVGRHHRRRDVVVDPLAGRGMDRLLHARVGAAAAEVGHVGLDVRVG